MALPTVGEHDFPSAEVSNMRTRQLLRNLRGDYDHSWDILAELCQNSVDGIRRKVRYRNIEIFVNAVDKDSDGQIGSDDLSSFHKESGSKIKDIDFEKFLVDFSDADEGKLSSDDLLKHYDELLRSLQNDLEWDLSQFGESYEELYGSEQDEINFTFDKKNKLITIQDTGIGIDPEEAIRLLAWHETDKLSSDNEIGEKGVGLTYCLFSSSSFELGTTHKHGSLKLTLDGAFEWLDGGVDNPPPGPTVTEAEPDPSTATGVTISIGGFVPPPGAEYSIYNLTASALFSIFMTRTAIGQTQSLFGQKRDNFIFNCEFIEEDGTSTTLPQLKRKSDKKSEVIPPAYLTPGMHGKQFEAVNFVEFQKFCSNVGVKGDDKKKHMLGKSVIHNTTYEASDRQIQVFACFGQGNDYFQKFSIAKGFHYLTPPDKTTKEEEYQKWLNDSGDKLYSSGIWLSTKGMPTGVEVPWGDIKVFGKNYFSWMHIVVNDDKLEFGTGRKHVHGGLQKTAKKAATELFNEIMPMYEWMQEVMPPDPSIKQNNKEQKLANYMEYQKLDDLGIEDIIFKKVPKSGVGGQEASVVSIFHELLMAGHLKGYIPLQEGYKQKYDLYADYEIDTSEIGSSAVASTPNTFIHTVGGAEIYKAPHGCVVEYKVDASAVFDDIENERKSFEDIDLLVCWEIDEKKLTDNHFAISEVNEDDIKWHGTTHTLSHTLMNVPDPMPVLCLSHFITNQGLNVPDGTDSSDAVDDGTNGKESTADDQTEESTTEDQTETIEFS